MFLVGYKVFLYTSIIKEKLIKTNKFDITLQNLLFYF